MQDQETNHEEILHEDEYTQLVATDPPDAVSGACHHYIVRKVESKEKKKRRTKEQVEANEEAEVEVETSFVVHGQVDMQEGPRKENPVNGMTDEDLARILVHRMRGFESGNFPSRYTTVARTHFETGLRWLEDRKKDRENRGVEGKTQA